MRNVRKIAVIMCIILLYTTFSSFFTASASFTPNFALNSKAVYMINLDTDIEIVSKRANDKMYPASTTKIMTALLTIEMVSNFDEYVLVPYTAFNEFSEGNPNFVGPSNAAIEPMQSNITYRDLLYTLMIPSACDSANILAYNLGGESIPNFVNMMNEKAKEIGCKNTHFSNPHGLFDENNYTTAYDLYLITKYAMDNYKMFMDVCSTTYYDMPANNAYPEGYTKYTTNQLIVPSSQYYYEGVKGVKTGSIDYYIRKKPDGSFDYDNIEYGSRSLVTVCEKNGYNYMIVSLEAPYFNEDGTATETNLSFDDHIKLYDWAFSEFVYTEVLKENEQIMQVDVDKGLESDKVGLVTTEAFFTLLPRSLDKSTIQQIRPTVEIMEAPIEAGTKVGRLELKLNGETLAKLDLVTESDIALDMNEYYKEKLKNIVSTPQFIAIVIVLGILIVLFIVARTLRLNHERKVKEQNRRRKINMAPANKKHRR